jgi:release factor glutamine methyltransferase
MSAEGTSLAAAIGAGAARLAPTSDTPRLDAELLMAHALGKTREAMLLGGLNRPLASAVARPARPFVLSAGEGNASGAASETRPLTGTGQTGAGGGDSKTHFDALVARRAAGEPLAYITGTRAFWTIDLAVAPGVLIPRPDSETLIEAAVAHFAGTPGPRHILDLGTGSGALLLAALTEWPLATGVGIDRSEPALAIARANAEALGLAGRAQIIGGGWQGTGTAFDLILCNPPYIAADDPLPRDVVEHEPHGALFAGCDGLDDYRVLAPLLPAQLARGGVACIEIGATQGPPVSALLQAEEMVVQIRHDLAGRDRCIIVTH